MPAPTTRVFALPDHLAAKDDPTLVAADEAFFSRLADTLESRVSELSDRLDAERRAPGGTGQEALDRDLEVHRLSSRLRTLRRYGIDLCLGRIVPADGSPPVHIGRLGLSDGTGDPLLVDWRTPAAEPFFAATHGDPHGLASRRRYRWAGGCIVDYWDEVFTAEGLEGHAALDDQSAFVASLGSSRTPRMRDVLGTIAADQDAVVRAGSRGALVVDGGPGTGKTVVALHRTAYLLYSEPRLDHRHGGVLFVGPSQPYLSYVSDVLPSLGEEGVRTCMLREMVPEGADARPEVDPEVARLKSSGRWGEVVEAAVRFYEEAPAASIAVSTEWTDVVLTPEDWAEAFAAPEPGTPHNEARDRVWEALLEVLVDRVAAEVEDGWGEEQPDEEEFDAYGVTTEDPAERYRRALASGEDLVDAFARAWPLIEPTDLVGDLWTVPAYLRLCAPWLAAEEVRALWRSDPAAWTVEDLPVLDAARRRLGDPGASRRRARQRAAEAAERRRMAEVVDHLIASDDSDLKVMSMLRGQDLRSALVDEGAMPAADADALAGPFAHVVVDEAQELTDAQWRMVLDRCPSRSLTVVGDRAQARHGFTESWEERLARVGLDAVTLASLTLNYRTPGEVMVEAEPVIRAAIPDANVPTSVRSNGIPVVHAPVAERDAVLSEWLASHTEGVACVVGDPSFAATDRVASLRPEETKGLEFDLVVLVEPGRFGDGIEGVVDRYVAMTRATERLVVLAG
ncbi:RNA polymerase recycling motor ATPase HelR [Phycicoccus avicenniae]|uniref:RNA polymerase recycling motor ATPase HelR n=1 Tax=Phycicoccus avicenniae TaxID=2828860 RepID=UPI003D2BF25C